MLLQMVVCVLQVGGKNLQKLCPWPRVTWGIDGSDETSEIYREGSSFKKVRDNFRAFIIPGGQKAFGSLLVLNTMNIQLEIAKQMAKNEGFRDFKTIISHRKDTKDVKHKRAKADINP